MHRGFTLVEVVIAVGVFAGAIAVVLSLLPSMIRQSSDSADRLSAQRMSDGLRVELERQIATTGFDSFAVSIPIMNEPLDEGLSFVATSDGLRLEPLAGAGSGGIAADAQCFLVEVWRFSQAPLAYDMNAANLPLYVRISWPYRVPGSASPAPLGDRDEFTATLAVDR